MQAITVRFRGPTNHNGARLIARCEAGRLTVGWDYALNHEDNYVQAASALVQKLGWANREWTHASLPGENAGYVFVPVFRREEGILSRIHRRLDRQEWSPDTLAGIADDLRDAGLQVRDPA